MYHVCDVHVCGGEATLYERMHSVIAAALVALLMIVVVLYVETSGRLSRGDNGPASLYPAMRGGGSGRRSPQVRVGDLLRYRVVGGSLSRLSAEQCLEFGGFVSGLERLSGDHGARVTVALPVEFLSTVLPFRNLVALARFHRIVVAREHRNVDGLKRLLRAHVCDPYCSDVLSWFVMPSRHAGVLSTEVSGTVVSAKWLAWYKCVHGEASFLQKADRVEFRGVVRAAVNFKELTAGDSASVRVLVFRVPLRDLMIELPKAVFVSCLRSHGIVLQADIDMKVLVSAVSAHVCEGSFCAGSLCAFLVRERDEVLRTGPISSEFPPKPATVRELRGIVHDWCQATGAQEVYEKPCNVCGLLTPESALHRARRTELNLSPLLRPGCGVTRKERRSARDAVVEIEGPVLYGGVDTDGYLGLCEDCLASLQRRQLPKMSLANGLWVGDVPDELRRLNFVEKLLVAVERHNVCVAKVTKGQYKMTANAVVYAQPVGKMYDILPPSQDELAEFLAIIFVGPCKPMPADLKRTPFIVRRRVVLDALRWLILNHCDYAGVSVSYENLAQYGDDEPPVCVVYRAGEGELPSESQPGYGGRDNEGSADGECSFSVQGLTETEYVEMSRDQKVAAAVKHFETGGGVLAYGHAEKPSSMYNNPQLFPRLFPWLFPYGLGGLGNSKIKCAVDRVKQVRARLMYGDRRFQTDRYFPFIAYNQEQIRASTTGGYLLTERSNFNTVAAKILSVDKSALDRLIENGRNGMRQEVYTSEEKQCLELLSLVDYVGGRVPGSMTRRKYQRSEIKSLIIEYGVPTFFVTFAPVDFKHPLCLYYCGEPVDLTDSAPDLPNSGSRMRAIASNPVACARFFDLMVRTFVKHVLRVGDERDRSGLFGKTSSYYGTVEEQGRLTLHLHALIWIENSLSPQEIRDRVLADVDFRERLTAWLESCHQGQYSLSTDYEIGKRIAERRRDDARASGDVFGGMEREAVEGSFRDPCTTLPGRLDGGDVEVTDEAWYHEICEESDEIVYLSNRHDPHHRKGCLRGDLPYCKARFPRELREETSVDLATGAISFKKQDAWINTYNVVLSYVLRCNTDVTCLLSGTQVKAVVAYVTDYITKSPLKTYSVFEAVKAVLERRTDIEERSGSREEVARRVITKVVNVLSARREIGGPAACSYLLGNPDHYTNREFKVLYWYTYLKRAMANVAPEHDVLTKSDRIDDKVLMTVTEKRVVGLSKVNDYIFRPAEFEQMSVYEYLRCSEVVRKRKKDVVEDELQSSEDDEDDDEMHGGEHAPNTDSAIFVLQSKHPLHRTHGVRYLQAGLKYVINFTGGVLPRRDRGDRELYCATMLVLFAPGGWRTGSDLLRGCSSWSEAFDGTAFYSQHVVVMKNMNVLYECADARDDYASQRRASNGDVPIFTSRKGGDIEEGMPDGVELNDTEHDILELLEGDDADVNPESSRKRAEMEYMKVLLDSCGYTNSRASTAHFPVCEQVPDRKLRGEIWKERVARAKAAVLEARRAHRFDSDANDDEPLTGVASKMHVDLVSVVNKGDLKGVKIDAPLQDTGIAMLMDTVAAYSLNVEQERAFMIIARAVLHRSTIQLRMYLGGMAGTGKSQVLRALTSLMQRRGELSRLLILAPTGSSACNVDGSTYHSALCIGRDAESSVDLDQNKLGRLRGNLEGVDIVFLDEISMVSCAAFYVVSAQLAAALNRPTLPFGGCHIIVAGDFGQLPPPGLGQLPLYSDRVDKWSSSQTMRGQMNAIGQALWRQFTTVVLLRQNMRQRGMTDGDRMFRRALYNLRVKACTAEDLALFRSRVVGAFSRASQLNSLDFEQLYYTSIITARNSHRDAINEAGSKVFAARTGQALTEFHSVDTWAVERAKQSVRGQQRESGMSLDPVRSSNAIHREIQQVLWNISPCMTEHHAGKLKLAKGMPVLLKNNEATELCATNGAQGIVYDWSAETDANGFNVLEVLFVKLLNPPKEVQVEGLPPNVVPIPRTKTRVKCVLPYSTKHIHIDREQVMVLPNFAMSDFASQGLTRSFNPVHIEFCRTCQALYTCLSRSASLEGTVILGNFDEKKMVGGLPSPLRREFVEFEILDDITRLAYEEELPASVSRGYRSEAVSTFLQAMGRAYRPPHIHSALDWGSYRSDQQVEKPIPWQMVSRASKSSAKRSGVKRKAEVLAEDNKWSTSRPTKRVAVRGQGNVAGRLQRDHRVQPSGFVWDSVDYSCAYDSILTILWNLYVENCVEFALRVSNVSPALDQVVRCYGAIKESPSEMEKQRDLLRDFFFAADSARFPRRGAALTAVSDIIEHLVRRSSGYGYRVRRCRYCTNIVIGANEARQTLSTGLVYIDIRHDPRAYGENNTSLSSRVVSVLCGGSDNTCGRCAMDTSVSLVSDKVPPIICAELYPQGHPMQLDIDRDLTLNVNGTACRWSVRGMIYWGADHFTCRYVHVDGQVWYHDGISTGRSCVMESSLAEVNLCHARGRQLSHVVYFLANA